MHPRRKWSDWSECSTQCKKTRHRLYCDDILAPQNRSSSSQRKPLDTIGEQVDLEVRRRTRLDGVIVKRDADKQLGRRRRRRHNQLPESQAGSSNNNDDDDYADEGDEEGDSLDSCDKVEASKTFQEINCRGGQCRLPFVVDPGTALPVPRSKQAPGRPEQDLLFRQQQQQQQQQLQNLPPLWTSLTSGYAPLDTNAGQQIQQLTTNQAAGRLSAPHPVNVTSVSSSPAQGVPHASNDSTAPRASLPVPVWTRQPSNLWPQQLFNTELGPQANLIQWSILIGALVSVVLLIMLTLRKLFVPSYHWMLAKQTLKSSSHTSSCAIGPLECGHHNCYSHNCPTSILPTNSPRNHHSRDDTRRPPQARPHMVNSSGQVQLIKSDLLEFNTDHLDTQATRPGLAFSAGARALVDTRASSKDLLRSFGDVASTSGMTEQAAVSPYRNYIDTSPPTQQAAAHLFHNKSYLFNQWLDSAGQVTQAPPTNEPPANRPATTSNKSSSSISSNASASDSPSIQSTTAQLISNAASSSFDHSQDSLPKLMNQSIDNSATRLANAQPASQNQSSIIDRPPHHKGFQVCLATKSQPNSPKLKNTQQASHFHSPDRHLINSARLTTFSGNGPRMNSSSSSQKPADCLVDSEYTQPVQPEPEPLKAAAQPEGSLRQFVGLDQDKSCEITERHFYEEIVHRKN